MLSEVFMSTPLIKQPVFNVWADQNTNSRIHIEVKGLGMVSINRTGEGVIIDVFDKSESNDSLNSLAFEDSDFSEGFADDLQREMDKYDPSVDLDALECLEAYQNDITPHEFIENYFKLQSFELSNLIPLKGECKPFDQQVRDLTRPYIKISDEQQKELTSGESNFYLTQGGKVVTFGAANGGYALMPLQDEPANEILAKQSLLAEILHRGELSDTHIETIENTGWHLWQSNGDYTDLELDVTYESNEETKGDRYSLNLHLTFSWEDNYVYMVLGTNLGDGFNEYHQVELGAQTLEAAIVDYMEKLSNAAEQGAEEDEYLALTVKYPEAWETIKAGAEILSETLGIN